MKHGRRVLRRRVHLIMHRLGSRLVWRRQAFCCYCKSCSTSESRRLCRHTDFLVLSICHLFHMSSMLSHSRYMAFAHVYFDAAVLRSDSMTASLHPNSGEHSTKNMIMCVLLTCITCSLSPIQSSVTAGKVYGQQCCTCTQINKMEL